MGLHTSARKLGLADPGAIVWDEVVAFWLVLWLITPAGFWSQAVAFVLFRFFDAVKPGPVGWADRLFKHPAGEGAIGWREGFGILFDDLVAAFCTLLTHRAGGCAGQDAVTTSVQAVADALKARGWKLATAESCTGGLLAAECTSIAGSSDWFERGFVTYSNEAKIESLGVDPALIAARGAVSAEVALAMAHGALDRISRRRRSRHHRHRGARRRGAG